MTGAEQIAAAFRAAKEFGTAPGIPMVPVLDAWKQLLDLDWSINAPWLFQHNELDLKFSLRPDRLEFPQEQGALEHMLRESWWCQLYNLWLDSNRRDASLCQSVPYSSRRCSAASKHADCMMPVI